MPIPSVLACKLYGPNRGAYTLTGGSSLQLGPDAVEEEILGGNPQIRSPNRIIRISANKMVRWIENDIKRSTDGGQTWTTVHTLTDGIPNFGHSGLYEAFVGGVRTMFGVYVGADAFLHAVKSVDRGVTWMETGSLGLALNGGGFVAEAMFNGVLFLKATDNAGFKVGHVAYDPANDGVSSSDAPSQMTQDYSNAQFLPVKGQLWQIANRATLDSDTDGMWLWRFVAGSWVPVTRLTTTTGTGGFPLTAYSTSTLPEFAPASDGFHYAIFHSLLGGGGGDGWTCIKLGLSAAGTVTHQSNKTAILPLTLRLVPGVSVVGSTGRWMAVVDAESNPGGAIRTFFYYTPALASAWTTVEFVNDSTEMVGAGSGGDSDIVPCIPHNGGGKRFFVSGQVDVEVVSRTLLPSGNFQTGLRTSAPLGTELVDVRMYHGVEDTPVTPSSLDNETAGTIDITGKILQGLVADGDTGSPTTVYVDWLAQADGMGGLIPNQVARAIKQ